MTAADRPAFAEMILGLGEVFNEPVSAMRIEIYFRALEDLPLEAIAAAGNTHVRTQKFFPRPAELRDAIAGNVEDRAELAWTTVLGLVRRFGRYNEPPTDAWPDHTARQAALKQFGGWRSLCERLPADGPGLFGAAKQFKTLYGAYDRVAQREDLVELSREDAREQLHEIQQELAGRGLATGRAWPRSQRERGR